MKQTIVGCAAVVFIALAMGGQGWTFDGQSSSQHGSFRGHTGSASHFSPFVHGKSFHHRGSRLHTFKHPGSFFHQRRSGRLLSPYAFRAAPPVVIITDPFFCFPHGLGFVAQDVFFSHLETVHGLSASQTSAFLLQTGPRLLFLGF